MNFARAAKLLSLLIITGLLASIMLGSVGIAYGLNARSSAHAQEIVTGSGSAGSGTLAVAYVSTFPDSINGAGAFSGSLMPLGIGGTNFDAMGLFILNVTKPANTPSLPCSTGQVSAEGVVTWGSFLGAKVLVAGCIGSSVPGAFVVEYKDGEDAFRGQGTGAASTLKANMKAMFTAEGVTTGSGTAGPGTVYSAEAVGALRDNSLFGGGAFIRTTLDVPIGQNNWITNSASIQPGCTLTTSGVTGQFGSFPNQSISSSYTLTTCPPTSTGPQAIRLYTVGIGDAGQVYKGTGTANLSISGKLYAD